MAMIHHKRSSSSRGRNAERDFFHGEKRKNDGIPCHCISTIERKRIEEPFGWIKTVGGLRTTRHRGRGLIECFFVLTAAVSNGMSLSGPSNMKQNHSEDCACSAH
jgi:hypothetical protein